MAPLVSILVPIYNHAKYLEECLNAVRDLNYPNFELILCNDGSTDDSYEIAKNWLERHPSLAAKLLTQENQGVCKTLNRLIRESSGEYITLCASDDVLTIDSLLARVNYLEKNPDKMACIGDAFVINEHSIRTNESAMRTLYNADFQLLSEDIASELVLRWSVVGPTLLIRRSAYEVLGLYDETFLVEDREFYLRLLAQNLLVFLPIPVASYRLHQTNISRRSIAARLVVLEQVARSNVKHSNRFSGVKKYFLASHNIDIFILSLSKVHFRYYPLQIFRSLRKGFFSVIAKLVRIV